MKEREFWREPGGGHVYAVELEDGLVTGSCGPLDVAEVDERFLPTFDYAPEQAEIGEGRRHPAEGQQRDAHHQRAERLPED